MGINYTVQNVDCCWNWNSVVDGHYNINKPSPTQLIRFWRIFKSDGFHKKFHAYIVHTFVQRLNFVQPHADCWRFFERSHNYFRFSPLSFLRSVFSSIHQQKFWFLAKKRCTNVYHYVNRLGKFQEKLAFLNIWETLPSKSTYLSLNWRIIKYNQVINHQLYYNIQNNANQTTQRQKWQNVTLDGSLTTCCVCSPPGGQLG